MSQFFVKIFQNLIFSANVINCDETHAKNWGRGDDRSPEEEKKRKELKDKEEKRERKKIIFQSTHL